MRIILICLSLLALPFQGRAAEISLAVARTLPFEEIERGGCSLRLSGRIEPGDADRL